MARNFETYVWLCIIRAVELLPPVISWVGIGLAEKHNWIYRSQRSGHSPLEAIVCKAKMTRLGYYFLQEKWCTFGVGSRMRFLEAALLLPLKSIFELFGYWSFFRRNLEFLLACKSQQFYDCWIICSCVSWYKLSYTIKHFESFDVTLVWKVTS